MHRRQEQLLKILAESDESMTASVLAEKMNVSVRSIRNYVSQLMVEYPDIVASSAKGYCVDQELAKDLLEKKNEDIPQNNKERAVYLATRLLKTGKDLDIYDIYDELFISESTFQLVLNRMRRMFSKYNLELCKEGNRLCIVGGERSKRHMMSDIVYEESQGIDRESLQKIFPDINFSLIETILQNILSKNHYFAQEYAVTEILLETAIAINQVMKGETIDSTVYYEKLSIPGHIYAMAEGLYRELGEHFHLLFEETEILDMASVLYAQTSSIIPQEKKIDIFHDLAGSETIEIMEIMLQRLKEDFGIILDDKEAELRFSLHMKKLILRARTRHFSHNPLKEYIKKDCPLVYDIAVNLCSVLVEKMALYVNDDEISYVAFYLGNALEESRDYQSRIKIVLNCPSYLSNAQILQKRIESMLKKRVYLMGIVSSEEYLEEYVEADLILTTCQLSNGIQKPNLIITPFFSDQDMFRVEQVLDRVKRDKRVNSFCNIFKKITFPEFFEHIDCNMTREEVIHHMCSKLYSAGVCDDTFEKRIWEREKLSSTGFENFAIPHTLKMHEKRSCVYILINDTPISWNNTPVQLILLLAFRPKERLAFNKVFELITESLLNKQKLRSLLNAKSLDSFIDQLIL